MVLEQLHVSVVEHQERAVFGEGREASQGGLQLASVVSRQVGDVIALGVAIDESLEVEVVSGADHVEIE